MKLQERDNNILRNLAKYAVLSTHQIARLTFTGVAHTTMMRRLRILEKEKFVNRGVPLDTGTNTWILAYKGRELMGVKPSAVFMNRNTIEHDVLITELRLTFESIGLASDWTPEWQMKSKAMTLDHRRDRDRIIPDGLMLEPISGQLNAIAVELERTRKGDKKYQRILDQYRYRANINVIWYVARDLAIINAIINTATKRGFPTGRLWFSLEDEIFSQKDQARVWLPQSARWLKLNSLGLNNLKPAQSPAQTVSMKSEEKLATLATANSANLNSEIKNDVSPQSRPSAPDPSHPTSEECGRDQELRAESEVGNNILKKCS